jgi:nitroimidazol reductase NimA-like FMN-containing flavoprotein (pyridoxamine 5'-phosphate oxidase superfamily)
MRIEELSHPACLELLARLRRGSLACASANQPYVTPFYFAYHGGFLHSFSTIGKKIEWMRANPLVCVEADEVVSPEKWRSVIVFGRFHELPDSPQWHADRQLAYELLQQHAMWWEPGFAKTTREGSVRPLVPVYFRISIEKITGRRAFSEAEDDSPEPAVTGGWVKKFLDRARGRIG